MRCLVNATPRGPPRLRRSPHYSRSLPPLRRRPSKTSSAARRRAAANRTLGAAAILRFGSSRLRSDNPRRAVNQFLVSVRRRGETASRKRRRGARLAIQAGLGSKRRVVEVPKPRPVGESRRKRRR